jgi:DNA polymerase eta
MEQHNDHRRIVLLFDLDCFYAQCERVRLGLENDCSLALLQWNSVLAGLLKNCFEIL